MANITDLITYYVNLLIIQYNDLPKAEATIALIAQTILADGIVEDIQNAYSVDTAVGAQLDVVGKYQGVDRYFPAIDLDDYFSFITYDEVLSLPSSPPRFGFSTYADYGNFSYNGTLTYGDIITTSNALNDDDFRTLIRLAIKNNNSDYSMGEIDAALFELFGTKIHQEDGYNMTVNYFIIGTPPPLIQAILFKNMLPRAMAVGINLVQEITNTMFAFTDYTGYQSPFGAGFSDYSNYATLPGQVLTYSQISEV